MNWLILVYLLFVSCGDSSDIEEIDINDIDNTKKRTQQTADNPILLQGGDQVGNGGHVVVCRNSIDLFDFWEGVHLFGHAYSESNVPFQKIAARYLARISFDTFRYQRYLRELQDFEDNAILVEPELKFTDDSKHFIELPAGCVLDQAVVQISLDYIDKRYFVQKNYWEELSEFEKAGLVIHEILYRDALLRGHLDSSKVRALNSKLFSVSGFESQESYFDFLYHIGLGELEFYSLQDQDPEDPYRWIYVQAENPTLPIARRICKEIAFGTLPRLSDAQSIAKSLPANFTELIATQFYGEVWSNNEDLTSQKNFTFRISAPESPGISRKPGQSANVICAAKDFQYIKSIEKKE